MSATVTKRAPDARVGGPSSASSASSPRSSVAVGDRTVLALLVLCFALLAALTWRKWGAPEIDAGAELTTADLIKHGATAYQDVRYYYGPLGLYSLALAFKLLGTSFATAYAFGLAQTAAILLAFYVLARQRPTNLSDVERVHTSNQSKSGVSKGAMPTAQIALVSRWGRRAATARPGKKVAREKMPLSGVTPAW